MLFFFCVKRIHRVKILKNKCKIMPKAKNTNNTNKKKINPKYQVPDKKDVRNENKDVNLIAGGLSAFCFALQGVLTHDPKSKSKSPIKNLVYSPFCLYSSLAALKLGTSGKTGKELEKILNFPSDSSILRSGFKNIFPSLQSSQFPPEFSFHMASRIFVSAGVQIGKEFLDSVENTFRENVTISTLDFGSKEAAVKEINKWASSATGNLVQNAVTKKTLEIETTDKSDKNSQLEILIVSAVYFKGFWNVDFPDFQSEIFYPLKGNSLEVPMMHRYFTPFLAAGFDDLDATVCAIPYKGDRLCMLVYLPRQQKGLYELEKALKNSPSPPSNVLKILYGVRSAVDSNAMRSAIVHMPKFKIECSVDLTDALKKTGLTKLFTPGPDFASLTSTKDGARVLKVVQKVVFEIDEKGTPTPMIREPPVHTTWFNFAAFLVEISFENPFYFQIVDKLNDIVLLAGTYTNPESK